LNLDRSLERARYRAVVGMDAENTLDGLPLAFGRAQLVMSMDALDNQDLAVELDLTGDVARKLVIAGVNSARFQRAAEGAAQSAPCGCDYVIKRGRTRRISIRPHLVMLGYLGVNAEHDRLFFCRQIGKADRACFALDSDSRGVNDISTCRHRKPLGRQHSFERARLHAAS